MKEIQLERCFLTMALLIENNFTILILRVHRCQTNPKQLTSNAKFNKAFEKCFQRKNK